MQSSKISITAIFALGVVVGILLGNFISVNVAFAQTPTLLLKSPNYPVTSTTTFGALLGGGSANMQSFILVNDTFGSTVLPTFVASGTLNVIELAFFYSDFGGFNGSSPLTLRLNTITGATTNPLDCQSQTGTYASFWPYGSGVTLSSVASTTKFFMTGTQCQINDNTNYRITRLEGSDSGTGRIALSTNSATNTVYAIGYTTGFVPEVIIPPDPPLTVNPAQNSFITITKPTPYGVTLPVGVVDTRAYFFFDVAQSTTTKTVIEVFDAVTNALLHTANTIVPAGSTVNFEMPVNFTMATGSKKVLASYRVASNNQDLLIPAEGFFNVGTNTYLLATGLESPVAVPAGLTQIECATFDVGCQFQKAIVFVFVPSQTVLNRFSTLWQELKYLKPFGYVSVTYDQLKSVSASSTSAYLMPTIPFMSTIFTPLKNAMSVILWGVFAFAFYKRLKNLDI